nr:hypothetical protein [uncultured Flavonifractor sp.]
MGGDPLAIPALVGMGIHKLSMSAACLAGAKRVIRHLDLAEATALAEEIQNLKTAAEIKRRLTDFAEKCASKKGEPDYV